MINRGIEGSWMKFEKLPLLRLRILHYYLGGFHTPTQPVFHRQQEKPEPENYNDERRSERKPPSRPLVPLLLDKVTNTTVRRQTHLIGCNYTCTSLTFHVTYGPKVNGVWFSCTFLGMSVTLHKYIQDEWIYCKLFIPQSTLSSILIFY